MAKLIDAAWENNSAWVTFRVILSDFIRHQVLTKAAFQRVL